MEGEARRFVLESPPQPPKLAPFNGLRFFEGDGSPRERAPRKENGVRELVARRRKLKSFFGEQIGGRMFVSDYKRARMGFQNDFWG